MVQPTILNFLAVKLWRNLLSRAIAISLLIHLSGVGVYLLLNQKSTVSVYDFGFDSSYNGLPPGARQKGKKVKLMERSNEEIVPKEKSLFGELPAEADTQESSQRSGDEGEIDEAVDMAFTPGAPAPTLLGGLKQYYPALAKELEVEATLYTSVIVSRKGKVLKVKVSRVVLSKKLPVEQEAFLRQKFIESLNKSFGEVVFTRPVVEGKNVPVEIEQIVRYTLTE